MTRKVIDLERVRAALAPLDALTPDEKRRVSARLTDSVDSMTKGATMTGTPNDPADPTMIRVAFFLPKGLLARLDAHAERLAGESPGPRWSRSDAMRRLLTESLDMAEAKATKPRKGR